MGRNSFIFRVVVIFFLKLFLLTTCAPGLVAATLNHEGMAVLQEGNHAILASALEEVSCEDVRLPYIQPNLDSLMEMPGDLFRPGMFRRPEIDNELQYFRYFFVKSVGEKCRGRLLQQPRLEESKPEEKDFGLLLLLATVVVLLVGAVYYVNVLEDRIDAEVKISDKLAEEVNKLQEALKSQALLMQLHRDRDLLRDKKFVLGQILSFYNEHLADHMHHLEAILDGDAEALLALKWDRDYTQAIEVLRAISEEQSSAIQYSGEVWKGIIEFVLAKSRVTLRSCDQSNESMVIRICVPKKVPENLLQFHRVTDVGRFTDDRKEFIVWNFPQVAAYRQGEFAGFVNVMGHCDRQKIGGLEFCRDEAFDVKCDPVAPHLGCSFTMYPADRNFVLVRHFGDQILVATNHKHYFIGQLVPPGETEMRHQLDVPPSGIVRLTLGDGQRAIFGDTIVEPERPTFLSVRSAQGLQLPSTLSTEYSRRTEALDEIITGATMRYNEELGRFDPVHPALFRDERGTFRIVGDWIANQLGSLKEVLEKIGWVKAVFDWLASYGYLIALPAGIFLLCAVPCIAK